MRGPSEAKENWQASNGPWLLLLLFLAFRLNAVLLLRPGGFLADFSDYYYYREYAALSDRGLYPFIQLWSPYPPLFPWILVAVHRLSLLLVPWEEPQLWFSLILGFILALADCGNLLLVYWLGRELGGRERALRAAAFYALLFAPFYTALAHFDTLPLLFLLAGLAALLRGSYFLAGACTGLGAMLKLLPLGLAPAALGKICREQDRRLSKMAAYGLGLGLTVLAISAPFLHFNPRLLLAPLAIQRIRPPWQTVWAVIEGLYGFGAAPGDVRDLSVLERSAFRGRVPYELLQGAFLAALAWRLLRQREWGAQSLVGFTAWALVLLFLTSKGWSPQYLAWLLPFIAILWPGWRGTFYALGLTALNYIESHLFYMLLPQERWLLVLTAAGRAILLGLLAADLLRLLSWQRPLLEQVPYLRPALAGLCLAALLALGCLILRAYSRDRASALPEREVAQRLGALAKEGAAVLFVRPADFQSLYPLLHRRFALRTLDDWAQDDGLLPRAAAQVASLRAPEIWLVTPQVRSSRAEAAMAALEQQAYRTAQESAAGFVLHRFIPAAALHLLSPGARFAQAGELVGWAVEKRQAPPELELTLVWRLERSLPGSTSAFVHLAGADMRPVVQADGPPGSAGASDFALDRRLLPLGTVPPGTYKILVGLYDSESGARLPLPSGQDALALTELEVRPR